MNCSATPGALSVGAATISGSPATDSRVSVVRDGGAIVSPRCMPYAGAVVRLVRFFRDEWRAVGRFYGV